MESMAGGAGGLGSATAAGLGRIPLFWRLQIGGWGIFAAYAILPRMASDFSLRFVLGTLTFLGVGFATTLALRAIYQRKGTGRFLSPPLLLRAVGIAFLTGGAWVVLAFRFDPSIPSDWTSSQRAVAAATMLSNHLFLMVAWSGLYFGIKFWRESQEQRERALEASALARKSQLQMLRYQLNPHFFFNSLNSIRVLVVEDPDRAAEMITQLSEFLRYSLTRDRDRVPLCEDLEAIRKYLAIEKVRFEERLEAQFSISPQCDHIEIPCFLLHPLVENAIKHGMRSSPQKLVVKISAWSENGCLYVEVANRGSWGQGSLPRPGTGTGLSNVRRRLETLYPGGHRFEIREESGWVVAALQINAC